MSVLVQVSGQRPESASQPKRIWGPRGTSLTVLGVTCAASWLSLSPSCYCRFIFILVNKITFHNKIVTNWKSCHSFGSLCIVQLNLVFVSFPHFLSLDCINKVNKIKILCGILYTSGEKQVIPFDWYFQSNQLNMSHFSIPFLRPFS